MATLTCVLAVLLAVVSFLPLSGTHHWWVRMWDFPRVQIAIGQAIVAGLALGFVRGWLLWAVLVPTLTGLALQLWRIRPFTPLARREMKFAPVRRDGHEVSMLAS